MGGPVRRCATEGCSGRVSKRSDLTLKTIYDGLSHPAPLRMRLIAHTRCEDHLRIYLIDGRLTAKAPIRGSGSGWKPCRIEKCPGVAMRFRTEGTITGPGQVQLNGLCSVHFSNMGLYGVPWRPDVLLDNEDCAEPSCHEPRMANELCISHVVKRSASIPDAREVLALIGESDHTQARISGPNRDTWRVLKEIAAIRDGESTVPQVPRERDPFAFGLQMVWGLGPSRDLVLWWAHRQSPYFIAKALGLDAHAVRLHQRYLLTMGLIVEDEQAKLPTHEVIVVRRHTVSKETRRAWVLENTKHRVWDALHYWPGYVVFRLPRNLPRAGEEVHFPVTSGPGVVSPEHQGRVWSLTDDGAARLRDWDDDIRADLRRQEESRFARRLGVAALGVGLASLVSITADAPQAWDNIEQAIDALRLNRFFGDNPKEGE